MDEETYKYRQTKYTTYPIYYYHKYDLGNPHFPKTHSEMINEIYDYEMRHKIDLIKQGRDKNTNEIGYFILDIDW